MKKDRLIVLTDAVLAIIMTILVLELEKPTTPSLEAFWDLAKFLCLFSFLFLVGIVMDGTKHIMERLREFPQKLFGGICFLLLERQEFSLENFMPSKIPV